MKKLLSILEKAGVDGPKLPAPSEDQFLTREQLLARLPVKRGMLRGLMKRGVVPYVRPGGRKLLFHWPSVVQSLQRHQRNGGDS